MEVDGLMLSVTDSLTDQGFPWGRILQTLPALILLLREVASQSVTIADESALTD